MTVDPSISKNVELYFKIQKKKKIRYYQTKCFIPNQLKMEKLYGLALFGIIEEAAVNKLQNKNN